MSNIIAKKEIVKNDIKLVSYCSGQGKLNYLLVYNDKEIEFNNKDKAVLKYNQIHDTLKQLEYYLNN